MDLTPVKTAAKAKFVAYLSPLSSFRMLCHSTESNKNLLFQKLGRMGDDVIFMSRVNKMFSSNRNNEDR